MTHFTHTNKLSRKRSFFTSFNTTMPQISVKKLVRHRNMQKLVNRQGALALLMIHLPNALRHLTQSKVPTVKRTLRHEHLNLASKYLFLGEKKRNLPNIKKCRSRSLDTINLMSKILQCEGPLPAGHLGCEWFIPCRGQFIRKNPALVMVRETSVAPDVALTQFFSPIGSIPPCIPKIK